MPQFAHCGAAKDALARCDREVVAQEQALALARQEVERAERRLKDLQETRRELQVTVAEFEAQPEPQYLEPWKHEYVAYQMVGAFRAKYSIQHEPAMEAARLGLRDYVQRAGANVLDNAIYDIVGAGLVRPPRLRGNLWMSMIVDPGHPRLAKFLKECGG